MKITKKYERLISFKNVV